MRMQACTDCEKLIRSVASIIGSTSASADAEDPAIRKFTSYNICGSCMCIDSYDDVRKYTVRYISDRCDPYHCQMCDIPMRVCKTCDQTKICLLCQMRPR